MRWYQVDSDTPNDPKIKRLMAEAAALEGPEAAAGQVGHLFLIWCFVANHGAEPGMGVKADGSPLDLDDMAYETAFGHQTKLRAFLDLLASRGLIGAAEWQQGIVFLPAMKTRADAYAKSKGAARANRNPRRAQAGTVGGKRAHAGEGGPTRAPRGPYITLQDRTLHHRKKPLVTCWCLTCWPMPGKTTWTPWCGSGTPSGSQGRRCGTSRPSGAGPTGGR
jgi:hypothetical protein